MMTEEQQPPTTPIPDPGPSDGPSAPPQPKNHLKNNMINTSRKERLHRACTARSSARLHPPSPSPPVERRQIGSKRGRDDPPTPQRVVTPLVRPPPSPSQVPRWELRSMWELASLLNFLHVFRPLLYINAEFSAEELETAMIAPNSTLDDVHIPLLKAIPPVTRMALGRNTWVTVLCRKLRDWWHWVADGEIPIVASHGAEVETYKALDPSTRVLILKALCDIRVEQEDIRSYIDGSLKHGVQLSTFRRERIGGDSHVSYWYEDDPIIGHRLYREIKRVEVKKVKAKGVSPAPLVSYQWETVATNFDEFQEVSDKLFESKNRSEVSLGKKLKIDILPEIEKIHKRKERVLKKQHRQAILLDSFLTADGISTGRSLRDRKPVTYTFDDYDKSINEAIKITKRRQSPEPVLKREAVKPEATLNGRWSGPLHDPQPVSYDMQSPRSTDNEETDVDLKSGPLDRSDRRRQRPQRYSAKEFVEAVSENEADFDSDDDIVGEAVYDDEYLRSRKHRKKVSSSSEGDEEYNWDEENVEDEEEEEDEDSLSISEDMDDEAPRYKKPPTRSRRGAKLRSVDEIQSGLRRSRRATQNRINYRQYELSESDVESTKHDNESDGNSDPSVEMEPSTANQDSEDEDDDQDAEFHQPVKDFNETAQKEENGGPSLQKPNSPEQGDGVGRRFLDLNELAPGTGFDDGPNSIFKGDDTDNF
ncbi:hypothetical protein QJS10_CPA10g00304 [Acorus calamus]|uniref:DDT domain-containing protein DDR4 n=1 Tax=Acorus calamus TaxID=4465 RepID=A0AAV9DYU3_ACOCL|nr:hypothetical protein QJS10_CPA10g00304 [Acorus calamus]